MWNELLEVLNPYEAIKNKPMKEYTYKVCLCDGHYCDGNITVMAESEEKAYNMVTDYVLKSLAKALPELGIDVSIELV